MDDLFQSKKDQDLRETTGLSISHTITLTINGEAKELKLLPWVTLLDALRERLDLTGTKKGCDHGQCGACTLLLNGTRINSCLTLAVMHNGSDITTIEGLAADQLHPLQNSFVKHDAFNAVTVHPDKFVLQLECYRKDMHTQEKM